MENEKRGVKHVHVVALPYPSQGHINPMLQFCKRLVSKSPHITTTFLLTHFISKSFPPPPSHPSIQFAAISDGFDHAGFDQAADVHTYLATLQRAGSQSLAHLLTNLKAANTATCVLVYDSFLPWALDVARGLGLAGASFFTQPCCVNYVYYCVYHGVVSVPVLDSEFPVSVPGMPALKREDMPSFIYKEGSYPAYFELVLNQFLDLEKADHVLVNTFYKLEDEVVDAMSKVSPLITIGPTIPASYLDDDGVENDDEYGLHLYHLNDSSCTAILNWLNTKPTGRVIYVSFGSMACLEPQQIHELAMGLRRMTDHGYYFLWVVRTVEEGKLPDGFKQDTTTKGSGLIVSWSPQLQVLSSEAVGCFFSHAGWNSTVEALSLGVPMVVMPQWTDQTTNAKFVADVWKVGVRVRVDTETGLVGGSEIERCIREVMEGEGGEEMKKNALKWRHLAKEAVKAGGTSDNNIHQFITKLTAI